jgi:hypothetical protein
VNTISAANALWSTTVCRYKRRSRVRS